MAALFACGDDSADSNRASPTSSPSGAAALSVSDWANQVCALSVQAANTLDTSPDDPATLTLDERKQRAAEVLAPRAQALGKTARELSALQAPGPAAAFHEVLHTSMARVSAAWLDLVDEAGRVESADQLNAANQIFIQAQDQADAEVIAAYEALADQVTVALLLLQDCGILNDVRS